jgi:hypothetical protein
MKLSKEERSNWTKEQKRFYKANGYPMPSEAILANDSPPTIDQPSITILCVRFGNKYGPEYVERLRNMIGRHLTVPYEFVCLTDDQHPIEGVRSILMPDQGYAKKWWHKVHMFDPSLSLKGRILYLDLDVVISGNLDKLASFGPNFFVGILDFNRKFHAAWQYLNSSVMAWDHGTQTAVYSQFKTNPGDAMRLHGDQDWIWKVAKDRIKWWPKSWIQSYKWEIRSRDELIVRDGKRQFKTVRDDVVVPADCAITVFHGDPNPVDVQDKFVIDNWR